MYCLQTFKCSLSISSNSSLIEQKIISSVFSKHYVRANILGNSSIQLLDNNENFINYTKKEIDKNFFNLENQNTNIGKAVVLDSFVFKHNKNNTVQINSFLQHSRNAIKNELFNLHFWLNSMNKYKAKKRANCTVLNSVKGGFFCHSVGVKGFLPRRQMLRAFFKTFFHFFENAGQKKLSNLNFLINKEHCFHKNGVLRLPILFGKINFATRGKNKNFSYTFYKKRDTSKYKPTNFLNFVFLTYLQKIKDKKFDLKNKNLNTINKSLIKKQTYNKLKDI
jgi:hypothetical protein